MNPQIFREYDIRGVVDKDVNDDTAEKLGRALGTLAARANGKTLVVGRDCRLHSTRLRDAFIKGAIVTGTDVYDVGVVPTPVVYFAANTLPVDGLAMITGSHNPAEYNGFKVGIGKTTYYGQDIQKLKHLIEGADFVRGDRPGKVTHFDAVTPYLHFVKSTVTRNRKLKVVVDAGNGVGGPTGVAMLQSLGYEVVPLFCEMDGRFPNHHPDPTVAKNLEALITEVKRTKADCGIAYDGDADRIGVVDEAGTILWGDRLLTLLARHVLTRR
jgi:phosphomannomutase/phosphoglucomutase